MCISGVPNHPAPAVGPQTPQAASDTQKLTLTSTLGNSEGEDLGLKGTNFSKRRVEFQDRSGVKVTVLNRMDSATPCPCPPALGSSDLLEMLQGAEGLA